MKQRNWDALIAAVFVLTLLMFVLAIVSWVQSRQEDSRWSPSPETTEMTELPGCSCFTF